ncbi:MAG: acylneuraminate cytidylyltransferase family protein [Bacillota bacterium]|nr:acylneuraminate cytidylyltransferase family protein [Bacillota bacterium]
MDNSPGIIAFIPARGGSKGIPLKNIKILSGKPLLAWTIDLALSIAAFNRVIVSTDNLQIARVAEEYGAEVLDRPPHLAKDDSIPADVVRKAIKQFRDAGMKSDILTYLQPTSPLREKKDVIDCLELLAQGYDSAATFTEAALHPHQAWHIDGKKPALIVRGAKPWLPRQQLEKAYQLNGSVYAFWINRFPRSGLSILPEPCGAVLMPKERSIDIDDMLDFKLAEILISERAKK